MQNSGDDLADNVKFLNQLPADLRKLTTKEHRALTIGFLLTPELVAHAHERVYMLTQCQQGLCGARTCLFVYVF